jgi:hypothetical protein
VERLLAGASQRRSASLDHLKLAHR